MGACTSKKSTQVSNDAIVSKSEIRESALNHLKNVDIEGDPMSSSMNSESLNATLKKMQKPKKEGEESKVHDKDNAFF